MSKRKRVPAPFQRILPGIIRTFGPRFVLIAGGVAMLFAFFGGSYLLSRAGTPLEPLKHTVIRKIPTPAPAEAQVLGASTRSAQSGEPATAPSSNSSVTTPVRTESQASQHMPAATSSSAQPRNDDLPEAVQKPQKSKVGSQKLSDTSVNIDTPIGSLGLHLP